MMRVPFFIMDSAKAQFFRDETAGQDDRLDPIPIGGGEYAGSFALARRVADHPPFARFADDFAALPVVELDRDVAFPPEDEEDDDQT